MINYYPLPPKKNVSRNLFKFLKMSDNVSETVQDRHIVSYYGKLIG